MKKGTAIILLFCTSLLIGCGSSGSKAGKDSSSNSSAGSSAMTSVSAEPITMDNTPVQADMHNLFTAGGWRVAAPDPASFKNWGSTQAQTVTAAKNADETINFAAGWFSNAAQAIDAYDHITPENGDSVEDLSIPGVCEQIWLTMPDNEGYWLIRRQGKIVMSAWTQDAAKKDDMIGLFNTIAPH
ncbi:hypothetical protein [Allobaculum mucilyticum]|uniref:hypothetical protein n=1 Tax=Allobaculum mucilyticum TaxID=2834459 RepID=UPI001E3C4675|nr:hypothetical protein [Allobaculum mucilyticum]UNT96436.1 hypothetical protein KWG62_01355 [Allobaculum mucilyticum]